MMFSLLLHKLRFNKQILPVTKFLLNLFADNLYSIKDTALISDLFFRFICLFADNMQLIFYV